MAACTLLLCTAGRCSRLAEFAGKKTGSVSFKKLPRKIKKGAKDVAPDVASAMQRQQTDSTRYGKGYRYRQIRRQPAARRQANTTVYRGRRGKAPVHGNQRQRSRRGPARQ